MPESFVKKGTIVKLSDYQPEPFLIEAAEKCGIELTLKDIPPKYSITLNIEYSKSGKSSQLFFNILQKCDKVVLEEDSFSMDELIKKHLPKSSL